MGQEITVNDPLQIDSTGLNELHDKIKRADALILELKTVLEEINTAKVSLELS